METDSPIKNWMVVGGIIVAIAGLFAFIIFTSEKQPDPVSVDISSVNIAQNPFIGSAEAPVVIAYWSDYQCPACKQFENNVMSNVVRDYVDAGKVKIVFKDMAFLGSDSTSASLVGRAVWEASPEKFNEWHTGMFEKQDAENAGWGNKADIVALAGSLGIDADKIQNLLSTKNSEYQKLLDADKIEANSFSIRGTPSVIIGKKLIFGSTSYSSLKILIESELGAVRNASDANSN